jgi:hypothetical protein
MPPKQSAKERIMADRSSKPRQTFRRHVVPFLPVALALATKVGNPVPPRTQPTSATPTPLVVFNQSCSAPHFPAMATPIDSACGIEGKGGAETNQNEAKNNFCASDPAKPVTLAEMVALQQKVQQDSSINFGNPRSHPLTNTPGPEQDRTKLHNLGEGDEVVIQAYVLTARPEGAESVNCGSKFPGKPPNDDVYHDIHISLVENPGDDECSGIVAELIPHHRPEAWTADLVKEVANAKLPVRVTGQRMFDSSHSPCTNGTPQQGDPKRASLWEVHPIYKFEVCTNSKGDCTSGGWVPLEVWKPGQEELP